jgi:hypothetical protein
VAARRTASRCLAVLVRGCRKRFVGVHLLVPRRDGRRRRASSHTRRARSRESLERPRRRAGLGVGNLAKAGTGGRRIGDLAMFPACSIDMSCPSIGGIPDLVASVSGEVTGCADAFTLPSRSGTEG